MNKQIFHASLLALLGLGAAISAGCNEEITQDDVTAAHNRLQHEQRELEETADDAQRQVREEEQETESARREALKPILESAEKIAEEERETQAAREAAEKAIREQEEELRKAEERALEAEAKFNAQEARDEYVQHVEAELRDARMRLDELKNQANELEGDAKKEVETHIETINARRQHVEALLDQVKSADALQWSEVKDRLDRSLDELAREVDDSV